MLRLSELTTLLALGRTLDKDSGGTPVSTRLAAGIVVSDLTCLLDQRAETAIVTGKLTKHLLFSGLEVSAL